MKKIFAIVLAGIMMLSLAACGGTGSSTPAAASSEPAGASGTPASSAPAASTLSGKVTTGGSTSVEKVVGAFIEAFMAENSGVDVTYDPTGSGAGITGAAGAKGSGRAFLRVRPPLGNGAPCKARVNRPAPPARPAGGLQTLYKHDTFPWFYGGGRNCKIRVSQRERKDLRTRQRSKKR